jgi:Fic family protein
MRDFNYGKLAEKLLTPRIVSLLTELHEHKARMELLSMGGTEQLDGLLELAKIQSIDSSNRIEGIYTSDARLRALALQKTRPRSRDEEEIAGYRDVLATVHESSEHIPVSPGVILQLHRDLYRYTGYSFGGRFKDSDNAIAELAADGEVRIRFQPMGAVATPGAVGAICEALGQIRKDSRVDPLLPACLFVLDFLCIHPFNDGNGRMSRLLTLLLFYRAGHAVGRYISIEKIIERTKASYYDALREDSVGWHEGDNDYEEFAAYSLGVLLAAYRDFEERALLLGGKGASKSELARQAIEGSLGSFTKADIRERCPRVSERTIEVVLSQMLKEGRLEKLGHGRGSSYALRPH